VSRTLCGGGFGKKKNRSRTDRPWPEKKTRNKKSAAAIRTVRAKKKKKGEGLKEKTEHAGVADMLQRKAPTRVIAEGEKREIRSRNLAKMGRPLLTKEARQRSYEI